MKKYKKNKQFKDNNMKTTILKSQLRKLINEELNNNDSFKRTDKLILDKLYTNISELKTKWEQRLGNSKTVMPNESKEILNTIFKLNKEFTTLQTLYKKI